MTHTAIIMLQGFALGLSLIMAIGAQNAFVLQQGLKNQHVLPIVLICASSDALLVMAGVYSLKFAESHIPELAKWMTFGGAAYLILFGLNNLRMAIFHSKSLTPEGKAPAALWKTILICLAFTWLNPHVYLDTFFLVGSAAASFGDMRLYFGIGAVIASYVFFFSLGYASKRLSRYFAKPIAWKILDAVIGLILLALAAKLLYGYFY